MLASSQLFINPDKNWIEKGTLTAAYQNIRESRIQRKFGSLDRSYREETVNVFSLNGDFSIPLTEDKTRILSYGFELAYNDVASNSYGKTLNITNHKIDIIGTRHGEKLYEALLSSEEKVASEDLGNYYKIPPDARDLNYKKFVEKGEKVILRTGDYPINDVKWQIFQSGNGQPSLRHIQLSDQTGHQYPGPPTTWARADGTDKYWERRRLYRHHHLSRQ